MKFKTENIDQQILLKRPQNGFTLLELMVSMTITLIIVGLLMGMTKMAVGAWQKTHAKTRSSRLAQEVFDSIGKDLEGIVIRTGNSYEWLLIKESPDDPGVRGPDADTVKEMVNPLEISFFSAVTDRYNGQINVSGVDMGGDISMVRYRLIHQDLIGAGAGTEKPVFALYRERIEPGDNDDSEIDTFNDYLAKGSIDGVKPSDDIVEEQNYLAENIFDFTLSFNFEFALPPSVGSSTASTTNYKRVVIQNNGTSNSLSIKGNAVLVNGVPLDLPDGASSPRLAGADVSILVLSDSGMNGLKNRNIADADAFAKYLKEKGHHYSKSVIVPRP